MAQLKLMKKEWFNWFDKTFLDNITAWTEYYYINPDSQHWISNNLIDILDKEETTYGGMTYSIKDDVIKWSGTCDLTYNTNIWVALKKPIPAGTTISINTIGLPNLTNTGISMGRLNDYNNLISLGTPRTIVTPFEITHLRLGTTYQQSANSIIYPMVVLGDKIPDKFSPALIKIEDILGVAQLKDLNWAGSNGSYYVRVTDMKRESSRSDKVFTTRYPSSTSSSHSFAHIFTENGYLNVIDDDHPTLSEFKDYLGDEYVIYLKVDSPY